MSTQQPEVLNLEYHVKQLTVKALNKFKDNELAAAALGVDKRTICRYKKRFSIFRDRKDGQFKIAI